MPAAARRLPIRFMLKNLFPFVLFVGLVVLAACNRKVATESNGSPALAGTWELREDQRGMMPTRQHEPGIGVHI